MTPHSSRHTQREWENGTEKPSFLVARGRKLKLLEELCASSEEDNPVHPEDLLPRWPTDPATDPDVASLLFEDFRQRQRRGEKPSIEEYDERFPEHKDSVAGLFHYHDFLRSVTGTSDCSGPPLALPSVGDEIFGFRLRHELGSGAFGRVFLAEEAELAGRLVVVKTSDTNGDEPQTMAQLQHTHIVPIHSVHEDTQAGLRAVCMPYFGGASLSRVLQRLWCERTAPTRGKQFVQALAAVGSERQAAAAPKTDEERRTQEDQSRRPAMSPSDARTLRLLSDYSYVQVTAWVVARLAEGLQHAHDRGVVHRDIKPSNILVSAEGQPMLLDFNLAHNLNTDQAQASATLGGTVAYMAPEHLRALASRDPNLARLVDQRSDIYALGMVLYEMFTGHNPFDQSGSYSPLPVLMEAMAVERSRNVPSLRERRPDVPWGIESIVRKCLAPDQAQRYQRAEHVAEDLKCFLEDRPLKYAPELSRRERLGKWVRRHPRLTSSGFVAVAAGVLLLGAGIAFAAVRENLAISHAQERRRAYEEGTTRALCLVNTTTPSEDHLQQGVQVCEQTLGLYDVLERDDWQTHGDWQRLDPEKRRHLAEDTRELLLLLAGARVRRAPRDETVLRDALALLDRARALEDLSPSPALLNDRANYLELLGDAAAAQEVRAQARDVQPSSARDHYLLATTYIRAGGPVNQKKAIAELNEAVRLNPRDYWSHFQRAMCFQERGDYTQAAADYGTCIGLWPEFAWAYFNRGWVLHKIGKREEALNDYTDALRQDPTFASAYLNRGLVSVELRQFGAALADYDRAKELGRDDASLHAGRGMALEGLGRFQEADAAFAAAFARSEGIPAADRARIRWTYGFAVAGRLPDKAEQAFIAVLQEDPKNVEALYGRGLLLVEQKQPQAALGWLNRALEADANFLEARRARAILLARQGSLEAAAQDINACLERDGQSGSMLYGAACVTALAAAATADPGGRENLTQQALAFVRAALEHGYGQDRAAQDPDLSAIRNRPEFRQILQERVAGPALSVRVGN
ncbi:MAG TPA: protein kinase [Gemmataceae bacterium]|nr:protein kinase [Gemmataceae bacterium]